MASSCRTPNNQNKYSWAEKIDKEGKHSKSLLIVCQKEGGFYLYEVGISENGLVEGNDCDNLPLVCELFDGNGALSVQCTSFGSNLHLVSNGENNLKTLTWNVKDWPCDSRFHDYPTNLDSVAEEEKKKKLLQDPFLLVGAFGKSYAITTKYVGIYVSDFAGFCCFDPITNRWETLSRPPFYSPSLRSVSGYAVLDQHDIILFCAGVPVPQDFFGMSYIFYSFNVCTREWKTVKMLESGRAECKSEHNPYEPYCYISVEDGKNYPFYGRAEIVDGVIYGYLFRTIVSYRFVVQDDDVFLGPPVLHHKARYPVTMQGCPNIAPFADAPAFRKAPFGVPYTESRSITYMGNNIFCVVETVEELPEQTHFQVVYINTFRLQGEVIEMLDSTIRLVRACSTFDSDQAKIMFCFAPFDLQLEWNRPPTTSLCANLKEYLEEKIPEFCDVFFQDSEDRMPLMLHARMLFSKWRCILQNSRDPKVQFFVEYMEFGLEGGEAPNLFLLVDRLDKGCLLTPHDSVERLDSERHVFVVLQSEECAIYKLEVPKTGVIGRSLLTPVAEIIKPNQDAFFGFMTFARLNENLFLFSQNELSPEIECCVFDMEKVMVVKEGASLLKAPKNYAIILAKGSDFYALSSPSRYPDSIPKPNFECFNPFSGLQETLEDAPFLSNPMELEIVGYAYVGDHILISLCDGDFYSYHVHQKKWMKVIRLYSKDADEYKTLVGRCEYVDGTIYAFWFSKVIGFVVEEHGDALSLHRPFEWEDLDIVRPPIPWMAGSTCFMTHLGNKVFCAIETGECSMSTQQQYACVTSFCIDGSHSLHILSSTICVFHIKELGTADITYCCTL